MQILLLSDIHANFPAVAAIASHFGQHPVDIIINAGDSLVYGPFPNEVLNWLQRNKALSILGNTDQKVLKLLAGKSFKKPSNPEKRIMYTWTAEALDPPNADYIRSFPTSLQIELKAEAKGGQNPAPLIGIYHGSPLDEDEYLFSDTPIERLVELAQHTPAEIVITGHSHSPFHRLAGTTHFINPGSAGRMFDGDPRASCAVLSITGDGIQVEHYRIPYPIDQVIKELRDNNLPEIYEEMFRQGKKLN
jgi:predicted phosphodiesterase